jgi:predicted nucleotidyltransferase
MMQDTDERLLALARRVAAIYTASEQARASAVLGSVARRQSDAFSDIDLGIYYATRSAGRTGCASLRARTPWPIHSRLTAWNAR